MQMDPRQTYKKNRAPITPKLEPNKIITNEELDLILNLEPRRSKGRLGKVSNSKISTIRPQSLSEMRNKTKSLSPTKSKRGRSLKMSRYSETPYNDISDLSGKFVHSPKNEEGFRNNQKIKELSLEMHRENCKISELEDNLWQSAHQNKRLKLELENLNNKFRKEMMKYTENEGKLRLEANTLKIVNDIYQNELKGAVEMTENIINIFLQNTVENYAKHEAAKKVRKAFRSHVKDMSENLENAELDPTFLQISEDDNPESEHPNNLA